MLFLRDWALKIRVGFDFYFYFLLYIHGQIFERIQFQSFAIFACVMQICGWCITDVTSADVHTKSFSCTKLHISIIVSWIDQWQSFEILNKAHLTNRLSIVRLRIIIETCSRERDAAYHLAFVMHAKIILIRVKTQQILSKESMCGLGNAIFWTRCKRTIF